MTTPNIRALCAELLNALEIQLDELRFNNRLCIRARAALAAEPVGKCPGCEGAPAASNSPCAVCGRPAAPPAPRPVELQALALVRKEQVEQFEAALALARQIQTLSDSQVLAEIGLRELPKAKTLAGAAADFHRRPDGSGWDRVPHAGRVDVAQVVAVAESVPDDEQLMLSSSFEILSRDDAAQLLGVKPSTLQRRVAPSRSPNGFARNGYRATRAGRGLFRLEPTP